MNFYVKNKINAKAKVTFYNCTSPVISKTTFDEYGVLSTPQFVIKLLVDGKEYYSNSKEVFNKASKDKEIDIEITETTLFGKKYMVHFNYIDKYK